MAIVVVGTNYRFSSIDFREKISFSSRERAEVYLAIKKNRVFGGAVILSTCNRIELYASAKDPVSAATELLKVFSAHARSGEEKISSNFYVHRDREALGHLISVACGLDSLIPGETQVLGQVKAAFSEAKKTEWTDSSLDKVFLSAIAYAGKTRRETGISDGKVSIGSIAVEFIKDKVGVLEGKNILIVGAGKVTELVLRYLKDEGPGVVFVSGRNFSRAKELAERIGQRAERLQKLPSLARRADVIISATASPHFVIRKETLTGAGSRKLVIVDLAVPRDVDPEVGEMENVELYGLESPALISQNNLEKRRIEAARVKKLIDDEAVLLWEELTVSEHEPVLWH